MDRKGDWFQTFSGAQFWPLDPRPEDVRIMDIAHHLARLCRFNGAVREFYSVAQHSVLVSRAVAIDGYSTDRALEIRRWGLLHDASEAYVGDMVRPLKRSMPEYRVIEAGVMATIATRFGLAMPEPEPVKIADNVLLMTERRDLLSPPPSAWNAEESRAKPLIDRISTLSPIRAESLFLERFCELFPDCEW